ncbi:tomoregulin-2a isoform X1 [Micropterus salmoides]|uniref:tomoregulin-2a isoform X1 n=1 Tax=Micropterus salmoides TaxID=27706 RepID=UPI0018EC6991|nr:tomoregulin-2a isoform X1 [Micropterus salmoides]
MGLSVAAQAPLEESRRLRQWSGTAGGWLRITLVSFLATLPVEQLRAFPSSLSDCQTPTGWNCSGFDDRDTDLFLCDTNTCKFDGECLRIGNMVTCICDFKCNNDYAPVCGSNNQNYQNECFLRRDACKQQSEVLIMSEGACPADAGSGSGDDGGEGSAEAGQKETSTCDICQFGAECDVDAEDVWCVCNIDCSHISFNPVCASDGRSYDNPCQVKEASCQKQERIEVKYLGHCQGDIITGNKGGDGHFARTDLTVEEKEDQRNGWPAACTYPVQITTKTTASMESVSSPVSWPSPPAAVTRVSEAPSVTSKSTTCSMWCQALANCTTSSSPLSLERSRWSSSVWWCSALPGSAHGPTGSTGRSRTMSTSVQRTPCAPPLDLSEPRHTRQENPPLSGALRR